jgi:hypothetical protein
MGTGDGPNSPLCLTDMTVFAEIPKVVNPSAPLLRYGNPDNTFQP